MSSHIYIYIYIYIEYIHDICLFLISLYFFPFFQMYTPLHVASVSGQISVVNFLLPNNVEVDSVNSFRNTSLHLACLNGQDMVVNVLISHGAVLNALNNKGQVGLTLI